MRLGKQIAPLAALFMLILVAHPTAAHAQEAPGQMIETHHESIFNPVFGSDERVAASCQAASQPCNWSDPATWVTGSVPDQSSLVIVDGHVQIQDQNATARSIGVYPGGQLVFAPNVDTRLQTADLMVLNGGVLEIGTASAPIDSMHTAEIVFSDRAFDSADSEQHLRGLIVIDGTAHIHGHPVTNPYLRTEIEPAAGATTITTTNSMTAAGWRVGDVVTIPTSRQCSGNERPNCASQTEDRLITALSSTTATLDAALTYNHPGARNHAGELDFTPHVINKSRNVILRSENPNGVRGHVLFHGRADVDMRFAEVKDMGRTNISNLGPDNQKGRYPIHAHHLIGRQTPQPNSYQFSLVGNVVDFGQANLAQDRKWGIAIHGSHFGLIQANVVDRASGAGIVTEDASESGNMFRENFVVRIIGGNGAIDQDLDPGDGTKLGRAGVGYWFNGGGRNFFEGNVAADISQCVYCYAYKFDNMYNGDLVFPLGPGASPHIDGGETVAASSVPINSFIGNEAYAVPNGLTMWWVCTFGSSLPDDECASRVDSFHLWHHHNWGYHGYPANNLTLANFVVRGDPAVLVNRYESIVGLEFGDYMHRNLVIENADVQNVSTAINVSSVRDVRGIDGRDVGVTTIRNSYLVATKGIGVWAPASVGGGPTSDLPPQTLVVSNVRFDYPAVELGDPARGHIFMHDTSVILNDDVTEYGLRNDVWVNNYNQAPGVDGDDLYIVPDYQGPGRCDPTIGDCAAELTAGYEDIAKGHIFLLLDQGSTPALGDVSCGGGSTLIDALMMSQHIAGTRISTGSCPLSDPSAQLNGLLADVDEDGAVDNADVSMVLQCVANVSNALCPAS